MGRRCPTNQAPQRPAEALKLPLAAAVAVACGVLAGCVAATQPSSWEPGPGVTATYFGGGLSANLPAGVRVPAVVAAADEALGSAGYVVTARDVTLDRGRVVARAADPRLSGRRVLVRAFPHGDGSRATIRVEPGGDPAMSREIMERMLTRLGL